MEIAENKFLDIKKEQKIWFEDFAGKYLHEITPKDIEQYRAERIKEVSKSTVNRILNCLSSLYNR
ncbi:MAG: phage integrase N-terminal SAM-like domain-containing protein [bacterium]|nr:phage integrase N-terminal SAM-like domain-containing protein [bacterium]